ncbi:MAG TPA: serine/threonine-protein kinase [Candidatus Acidoferrales bacterium]|nr:serine/threonine-protein kinase [Candidatus Acidoferrales bacterium]
MKPEVPSSEESLRWQRVLDAFSGALDREGAEREAYLHRQLAGEREVIAEVRAMLDAHERLEPLAIDRRLVSSQPVDPDLSGSLVGGYRLVRRLATGGMSEVYEAERDGAHFRQRVALKLLRTGLSGPEASLRFRQERQILARLTHPLIVPLLDGGLAPDGRPYLVLQYVQGELITVHCDRLGCAIEERLRLFLDVARAVGFAHRNLIVHRDIKPSNVLVTAEGGVRLLDFGVAKLLEGATEDELPLTRTEARMMTLEYAAPEQVQGGAITVATDVYGLGALLYELLAGRRPFVAGAESRGELELRIVREMPELPGVVASATRGERWSRRLRGELDTIVMKALAKEPDRRYPSAGDLAADVARFLEHRPIVARSPSVPYRLRKIVRRNRIASAVAFVSALLILALTVMVCAQSVLVTRERDLARAEQQRAESAVSQLVDLISSANPEYRPGGNDITLGQFLKTAEASLLRNQHTDPGVRARLSHALGRAYLARTQYREAQVHLEAALTQFREIEGARGEGPYTAAVRHDLARLVAESRSGAEGVPLLRESLNTYRRIYGMRHPLVAQCLEDLGRALPPGGEKRSAVEEALAMRRSLFGDVHLDVARSLGALGALHYGENQLGLAEQELKQALRILQQVAPEEHPATLLTLSDLADVLEAAARYREAEPILRELLEKKRRVYGPESVPVAVASDRLAVTFAHLGRLAEAEHALRAAYAQLVRLLGPVHIEVASTARNIARTCVLQGRNAEAEPWFREGIAVHPQSTPKDQADMWYIRGQAAVATARLGRREEAMQELRLVLANLALLGAPLERTIEHRTALGFLLLDSGRHLEAAAMFSEALEYGRKAFVPEHPRVAEAECALGLALAAQGRPEGRKLVERKLPQYSAWGLADPVYLARMRGVLSQAR